MNKEIVWRFTNKKELDKKEFIRYLEKKVFKTIRKHNMLPPDKVIKVKRSNCINSAVLEHILKQKFQIKISKKPNFSDENLSFVAEKIFENLLKGKFEGPKPKDEISRPLYFITDEEIETYARLKGISGLKRKENKKIRDLFSRFKKRNPDLELNIVRAISQIQISYNNQH